MLGPQKNVFHFWYSTGSQICLPKNPGWWGQQRRKIQFKNGQMHSQECIGKLGIIKNL